MKAGRDDRPTKPYRGTIAYDDDDIADPEKSYKGCEKYRDPVRRKEWYKAYWKTEKYLKYQREAQRKRRQRATISSDNTERHS